MPPRANIRPRIAMVYDLLYPWMIGGVEKRYWEIARRLPVFGFEPHLIGPKCWDGHRSIEREGVWLHGAGPVRPAYKADGTRTISEPLMFARDLIPALMRLRVDLIDCCAFPFFPWYSARAVAACRHIPIVTTTPEWWGDYWLSYLGPRKGKIAKAVESLTARLSQNQICLSPFTRARLNALPGDSVPIHVVPAGIDAGMLEQHSATRDRRSGIVVVSRLTPHKRVADAITAFSRVYQTHPEVKLTIVGKGTEECRLRTMAERLGVSASVLFLSDLGESELYSLIGRSVCLLLPSEREGQGLVVAEAQATGTPPIVARAPESAAIDFVDDEVNGRLYPAGNVQVLADDIAGMLDDADSWQRLSTTGMSTARRLDWDGAILPAVAKLYTDLLQNKAHGVRVAPRMSPNAGPRH